MKSALSNSLRVTSKWKHKIKREELKIHFWQMKAKSEKTRRLRLTSNQATHTRPLQTHLGNVPVLFNQFNNACHAQMVLKLTELMHVPCQQAYGSIQYCFVLDLCSLETLTLAKECKSSDVDVTTSRWDVHQLVGEQAGDLLAAGQLLVHSLFQDRRCLLGRGSHQFGVISGMVFFYISMDFCAKTTMAWKVDSP